MTKLDWSKAKIWREPAYPDIPLEEYLNTSFTMPHPDLLKWNMEKYNGTIQREHEEVIRQKQAYKRWKQREAYIKFLETPVHCNPCGKKRTPKEQHSFKCEVKTAEKYGWHYGTAYPPPAEELARREATKEYHKTPEYIEEMKRRKEERKRVQRIIKMKRRQKEARKNG